MLIQQISNIPLAVVHHQWIVLIPINGLHTVNRRTLHCRAQGKPCVLKFVWVKSCRLSLQISILPQDVV